MTSVLANAQWSIFTNQVSLDVIALLSGFVAHGPAFLVAIIVLTITSALARGARHSSEAIAGRTVRSRSLQILLEKAAHLGTWIAGSLIAALIAFPGLRLGDLVATLGLTSVAVGFAFQDIFKNFLAGILLLLNEPFRIGDQIIVGAYEGTVEHIDIRFTSMRTYAGERVLVPNSIVFTSPVQVRTAFAARRTDITVGLAYTSDLEAAIALLNQTLVQVDGVHTDPPPRAEIVSFGDSTIQVALRFWHASHNAEMIKTRTRVVVATQRALSGAGIDMPFPIRTLFFGDRRDELPVSLPPR